LRALETSSPSKVAPGLVLSDTTTGATGAAGAARAARAAGAAIGTRGAGCKCSVDVKFRSPVATLPMQKNRSFRCLLLGELSLMFADSGAVESDDKTQLSRGADDNSLNQDHGSNNGFLNNRGIDLSGIDGPQSAGVFKSSTLLAHRDCVTGLAVGGKNPTLLMSIFKTFAILLVGFFCS